MHPLHTERLTLLPSTLALLDAELNSLEQFSALLGAEVPPEWPTGEYDRAAIEYLRERLIEHPDWLGWLGYYILLSEDQKLKVIGAVGFFGPPDENGDVEVGYSVVPAYGGRGFATETLQALVRFADRPEVKRVVAQTYPSNQQSIRVLEKNGFTPAGPGRFEDTVLYHHPFVRPKED